MSDGIELVELGLPALEVATTIPQVEAAEYDERMRRLIEAASTDWLAVYGDREHLGNIAYACGFDPRFEEALLLLGSDNRYLILGKEGLWYAASLAVDLVRVWTPMLSLNGHDRSEGQTLDEALAACGIRRGHTVGVAGWKEFSPNERSGMLAAIAAPGFVVDALRGAAGSSDSVLDATSLFTDPDVGQRIENSADQIAFFEFGASRASAGTFRVIQATSVGKTEIELMTAMAYSGEPLLFHPIMVSGPRVAFGIGSPTDRVVALGDAIFVEIGMWGGNGGRGGMVAASESDIAEDYLLGLAIPYWRAVVTWWETVRLGQRGRDIYDAVTAVCRDGGFEPFLATGHLLDWEDWPHTPLRRGSPERIRSGMVLAADIYAQTNGPEGMAHCEDTVAVGDESLRAEIAERHPSVWARISARRTFMREALGIQVPEELLPISVAPGYFPPFWLAPGTALRRSS